MRIGKMAKDDFLTDREEEILEELMRSEIAIAARKLRIASGTIHHTLYNIRQKRIKATNTINRLNNYTRRDRSLMKLLAPTKRYIPKVESQDQD